MLFSRPNEPIAAYRHVPIPEPHYPSVMLEAPAHRQHMRVALEGNGHLEYRVPVSHGQEVRRCDIEQIIAAETSTKGCTQHIEASFLYFM